MTMYYKALKGEHVVDVLENLIFVKYQDKHKRMVLCDESEAQGVLSSDREKIWHDASMYKIPVDGYETVVLQEIDEFEYKRLKIFNGKTPQEIIDEYTLSILPLLTGGNV